MKSLSATRNHGFRSPKELERYFKGIANHRRIEILLMIRKNPSLSLDNITEKLEANYKTISGHVAKLIYSGLVSRNQSGERAEYTLTSYGKEVCIFMEDFMSY